MNMELAKKEEKILNGKILPTLFVIALPLFFNYLLELIYSTYDTFVLASTGIGDAGSVVLLSQVQGLLSTCGLGLISGSTILIASYLGRGDTIKSRMVLTQILYIISIFSILCTSIFIGFGKPFLRLLGTPIDIVNSSYSYYIALIISMIIGLFNTIYSSILTASGNTKRVLINNALVIITKVILSSIIVFSNIFKNINSSYLAFSTIIAQLTMFIPAIIYFFSSKNELAIVKERPHKKMIKKIITLSLPIILGGIVFNLTKVIINSMIINSYGSYVLTFYGLEGLFYGICTKFILAVQNASSTMIGQAMGNNKFKRSVSIYKISLMIGFALGILNFILFYIFKEPLSLIAMNNNQILADKLVKFMMVYYINALTSPILELVISYLNSLRITKPKLVSDILRTTAIRLPLLAFLIHCTNIGYLSVAIVFSVSNFITLIIMFTISMIITKKINKRVNTQKKLLLPSTILN